jgi:hypothetical protein|tara:strand:+ start:541 stop:762 length:222 start_codon:yes stop_codon:yes gene_type:complete
MGGGGNRINACDTANRHFPQIKVRIGPECPQSEMGTGDPKNWRLESATPPLFRTVALLQNKLSRPAFKRTSHS